MYTDNAFMTFSLNACLIIDVLTVQTHRSTLCGMEAGFLITLDTQSAPLLLPSEKRLLLLLETPNWPLLLQKIGKSISTFYDLTALSGSAVCKSRARGK